MVLLVTARKIKTLIAGADAASATSERAISDFQAASVPISLADCRNCSDPCDEGTPRFSRENIIGLKH